MLSQLQTQVTFGSPSITIVILYIIDQEVNPPVMADVLALSLACRWHWFVLRAMTIYHELFTCVVVLY